MKELNISKGAGKLKAPIKLTTTVCVKLEMTQEVSLKLEKTRQLYRDACNFLVPFACTNPKERNWQRFNPDFPIDIGKGFNVSFSNGIPLENAMAGY